MKKLLAVMMAVVLMTLPTMSLAAETVSVTMKHGSLAELLLGEELGNAINQLIDMISLDMYHQGDDDNSQVGFALKLSGETAANVELALVEDDTYAASNLLGNSVVKVNLTDVEKLLEAQGLNINLMEFESIEFDLSDIDLTKTRALVSTLMERVQIESVPEYGDGASKMTLTLTVEEGSQIFKELVDAFYNTAFFKQVMQKLETIGASVEIYDSAETSGVEGNITFELVMDTESTPVSANVVITSIENGEEHVVETLQADRTMIGDIMYVTVTEIGEIEDASVTNVITLAMGADTLDASMIIETNIAGNNDKVNVTIKVYPEQDKQIVAMSFAVTANDETVGFALLITATENGSATHTVIDVLPLDSEQAYITLVIDTDEVADMASIVSEDAVQPLNMTEEELGAFMESISETAQIQLITVMQKLPTQLLYMIMQ